MPSRTNTDKINDIEAWSGIIRFQLTAVIDKHRDSELVIAELRAEIHRLAANVAVLERDVSHLRGSREIWGGRIFAIVLAMLSSIIGGIVGYLLRP